MQRPATPPPTACGRRGWRGMEGAKRCAAHRLWPARGASWVLSRMAALALPLHPISTLPSIRLKQQTSARAVVKLVPICLHPGPTRVLGASRLRGFAGLVRPFQPDRPSREVVCSDLMQVATPAANQRGSVEGALKDCESESALTAWVWQE